jgi:hypothetical protein
METSGSITLGEVAERTAVLAVACSRCERAGRYNLDTLIARHGEGFGIPELLRLLSEAEIDHCLRSVRRSLPGVAVVLPGLRFVARRIVAAE